MKITLDGKEIHGIKKLSYVPTTIFMAVATVLIMIPILIPLIIFRAITGKDIHWKRGGEKYEE